MSDKKALRKEIIRQRLDLPAAEVTKKSAAILARLEPFWQQDDVQTVMTYIPFRNEVDMMPLIRDLLASGRRVVIPVCQAGSIILPSELRSPEEDLTHGTWGILEPKAEALRPVEPETIDCVIVPGVAFDRAFNRLGYGAGYYDRFLLRLRPAVPVIAPCYEMQLRDNVFPEPHDQLMSAIATENELLLRAR